MRLQKHKTKTELKYCNINNKYNCFSQYYEDCNCTCKQKMCMHININTSPPTVTYIYVLFKTRRHLIRFVNYETVSMNKDRLLKYSNVYDADRLSNFNQNLNW